MKYLGTLKGLSYEKYVFLEKMSQMACHPRSGNPSMSRKIQHLYRMSNLVASVFIYVILRGFFARANVLMKWYHFLFKSN